MALLSLSESCHFPDDAQQEIGTDYILRAREWATKQRKAQGREEELIKFMFNEVHNILGE